MKTLKRKTWLIVMAIVSVCLNLTACSSNDEKEDDFTAKGQITGKLEKGPFLQGSKVILYELNNNLSQTGKSYKTNTTNDLGEFSFDSSLALSSQYAELETNGYFYNETEGEESRAPITLNALVDLSEKGMVNVNLITHLEFGRVKKLVQDGKSFKDAKKQAEQELLACFAITHKIDSPENISLMDGNDNAKILLAISSILLYRQSEARFSELISKFSTDFARNGTITDTNIRQEMQSGQYNINPKSIVKKMKEHYTRKGVTISIEDFSQYVDRNGDGVLDENDAFTEVIPDDQLTEENIFQDATTIQNALDGIYAKLVDFTTLQLTVEAIRTKKITASNLYNLRLDTDSRYISDLWKSGYQCIHNANFMIEALSQYNSNIDVSTYITEVKLLRAFVYYNMTLLWGNIPLVTIPLSTPEVEYIQKEQNEILDFVYNELNGILPNLSVTFDEEKGGKSRMGYYSALALAAEVKLLQGKKTEAINLLNQAEWDEFAGEQTEAIYSKNGQSTIFSLSLLSYSNTGSLFNRFLRKGDFYPIYSYAHINLLKKEAKDTDISSLLNEWLSTIGLEYGYWGTLKRTKTAISTTGCKEYELLLPIPQIELVSCPTLIQNPGSM